MHFLYHDSSLPLLNNNALNMNTNEEKTTGENESKEHELLNFSLSFEVLNSDIFLMNNKYLRLRIKF